MTMNFFNRAAHSRNIGSLVFRGAYSIDVHGSHNVPLHGPLIVAVDTIDPIGQALIKSLSPRPLTGFTQILNTEFMGDIPFEAPFGIKAQLDALDALRDGRAILVNTRTIEPGFLLTQSQAGVVPVSLWIEDRGSRRVSQWTSRPALARSRVRLYFGTARTPIVSEDLTPSSSGLVTIDRFASERCRQILQDHYEEVRQRIGERTAR